MSMSYFKDLTDFHIPSVTVRAPCGMWILIQGADTPAMMRELYVALRNLGASAIEAWKAWKARIVR